ncbi:ricin-type beta-trefoil lectin domain protein [Streptomyces bambusae]|uniref:Ricin B lectin domain-containing protein n=1 Tax=Streptomyces bambusae TaxID=1550616 RepID=A0ABS6YYS6_9ACTN|nr:ricin-type beta-trefoil lectin domain protein [Streptomyces bambusae]MBW5480644.1 hypothetical protein [Streptomyces bambusae]
MPFTTQLRPSTPAVSPARVHTLLRFLLSATVTIAVIAAALVIPPAIKAYATAGDHRPATWNMQGGNGEKWIDVSRLSNGRSHNVLAHDVVALQEAGPYSSVPGTQVANASGYANGTGIITGTTNDSGNFEYHINQWTIGTGSRSRTVYITWLNTDTGASRNNVAIVTHDRPRAVQAIRARNNYYPAGASEGTWGQRPAIGVQLADGSWYYSFHASSMGDTTYNDAQNLVNYIRSNYSATRSWGILGDFNRRPSNLNAGAGAQIYRSGVGTHDGGGELDYMVSNDTASMVGWTGRLIAYANSDHRAVEFGLRAYARQNEITNGTAYSSDCLNVQWGGRVNLETCNGNDEQWAISNLDHRIQARATGQCLDRKGGSSTEIITYNCWEPSELNQLWQVHDETNHITPLNNYSVCLEARTGDDAYLLPCDDEREDEEWVMFFRAPYYWAAILTVWAGGWDHNENDPNGHIKVV